MLAFVGNYFDELADIASRRVNDYVLKNSGTVNILNNQIS